jgi:hypothetical protein
MLIKVNFRMNYTLRINSYNWQVPGQQFSFIDLMNSSSFLTFANNDGLWFCNQGYPSNVLYVMSELRVLLLSRKINKAIYTNLTFFHAPEKKNSERPCIWFYHNS